MWRELFRHGLAPVTLAACLGEGVYALNAFLVATAMPVAVRDLGGIRYIAWTTTVYMVAAIVAGSAAGFLKGRLGARRLLLAAAGLFLVGTLAAGGAVDMPMVLLGRLCQGAGEGVIAAACYSVVAERLPAALVPKAFGLMAMVWAVAAFGGPLLGGVLTQLLSWRAAFLINIPLILIFAALVLAAIPPAARAAPPSGGLPLLRLGGIAGGIMLIAVASVAGSAIAAALATVAGLAMLVAVFVADRSVAGRLFPSDAFAPTSVVGAGLWVVLLMPLGQASTATYLPITVQSLWGYSPTAAGALVAVLALSWSGAAVLVAMPRNLSFVALLIRLGAVLVAAGLVGAAVVVPLRLPIPLILCQMVIGIGFGIGWGFLNQAVAGAARPGERDLAAALVPTTQSAGYAIGSAIAGLAANASGFADALQARSGGATAAWVFGLGAGFAAAAVVLSLRVTPRTA